MSLLCEEEQSSSKKKLLSGRNIVLLVLIVCIALGSGIVLTCFVRRNLELEMKQNYKRQNFSFLINERCYGYYSITTAPDVHRCIDECDSEEYLKSILTEYCKETGNVVELADIETYIKHTEEQNIHVSDADAKVRDYVDWLCDTKIGEYAALRIRYRTDYGEYDSEKRARNEYDIEVVDYGRILNTSYEELSAREIILAEDYLVAAYEVQDWGESETMECIFNSVYEWDNSTRTWSLSAASKEFFENYFEKINSNSPDLPFEENYSIKDFLRYILSHETIAAKGNESAKKHLIPVRIVPTPGTCIVTVYDDVYMSTIYFYFDGFTSIYGQANNMPLDLLEFNNYFFYEDWFRQLIMNCELCREELNHAQVFGIKGTLVYDNDEVCICDASTDERYIAWVYGRFTNRKEYKSPNRKPSLIEIYENEDLFEEFQSYIMEYPLAYCDSSEYYATKPEETLTPEELEYIRSEEFLQEGLGTLNPDK